MVDNDVRPDEVAAAVRDPSTLVWVDLLRPPEEELSALVADLGLPATAVEDALAPYERPKVTRHDNYLFFTVYATTLLDREPGLPTRHRIRLSRVSGILTPKALVTIRLDAGLDMGQVERVWADNPDLLGYGAGALAHGLLDVVVDGHFDTIQQLDDEAERLEDQLFDRNRATRAFIREIYGLRQDLVALRRVVLPMREVVNALLRHGSTHRTELDSWYDDLYDHVLRAGEWSESLRDMVSTMFETNLSLQDSRLNEIMKKLAGWAAVIAVPTAITGWFGQNIPFWGYGSVVGFVASVVIISISTVLLWVMFRRRDWL